MKVIKIVLDDDAISKLDCKVYSTRVSSFRKFKELEKLEDFEFYTTSLYFLRAGLWTIFDKIFFVRTENDAIITEEIWPDDSLWNITNKEIRQAHNLNKLLIPYIDNLIYTEEEQFERAYSVTKALSVGRSSEFSFNNKTYYFVDGIEVSAEDWERRFEAYQ